ncbi:hypothetical protein G6F23_015641 [Rhizopus arrhizus]|nr:hypothetical protein G6F23_015641 [Rhizopus arrhizus]
MVGHHDHVGCRRQPALLQSIQHLADDLVGAHDGVGILLRIRAVVVAGLVHVLHVQRGQARRIGVGLRQPVKHDAGTLFQRFLAVVDAPLARAHPADFRLAARPRGGG